MAGAVVGGSGLVGLIFYFLRRYLDKKLQAAEEIDKARQEIKKRRLKVEDELHHAYGRLFFWLHRAVTTERHNGELETALRNLNAAEEKKKELDREIIAESERI